MSAARYAAGVYRRLLWLYPRRFREEYGNDLVLLLTDQLRDEPAGRVFGRAAVDLALTIPAACLGAYSLTGRPRGRPAP
ncbi:MAG TPA: hypothetical protein VG034_23870 [Acidimicrobiia bacterium]|jgi:hypothetical protein|nr:hypothetical protein [Acidimicrobiia bacterium]